MMKWMAVIVALLLSACSSETSKTYYQLPALNAPATVSSSVASRQLWVEHVSVADYLAAVGVVYQTNDVQYVIANNNLWASPLDQQLRELQPVLRTLNEKSNALVFEAAGSQDPQPKKAKK